MFLVVVRLPCNVVIKHWPIATRFSVNADTAASKTDRKLIIALRKTSALSLIITLSFVNG
jgi:hypothetical protein